jgi:ABC-type bacteriocin/lantibiotic exporter with double-glycine peptidase domain
MSVLILAVGGIRVMDGVITVGMLVAFQTLAVSFLAPVNNLMQLGGQLQELQGDLTRLDDVLQNPAEPALSGETGPGGQTRLQGHVELRNVTFGYNPTAPPLISDLSITIQPGQRVALVGSSGSGKSTIAKLICGIYEPTGGEILFDGVSRRNIPRSVLANSLAVVDQDIILFGGTVKENLTLWDSTVSDDELFRACRDAEIHQVIVNLPHGFESTLLEDASNLSGGQRQRLEIARALATNSSILILDEAMSALDTETERWIDVNIKRRGCTLIIVSHRLSTIRDCDEILVLDAGNVVQRGSHRKLMAEGGLYVRLLLGEGAAEEEVVRGDS